VGWKDSHFELPLELWDSARSELVQKDGIEPHITVIFSASLAFPVFHSEKIKGW
jgi:hypothetical protein